jgi:hypothetical protein
VHDFTKSQIGPQRTCGTPLPSRNGRTASPARASSTICGIVKPCASIMASVQPSRQEASSSSARQAVLTADRRQCHKTRSPSWPEGRRHLPRRFKTAAGQTLAISCQAARPQYSKHFQARMPYGLGVVISFNNRVYSGALSSDLVGRRHDAGATDLCPMARLPGSSNANDPIVS